MVSINYLSIQPGRHLFHFLFFAALFSPFTSFFNLASTILYLPLTPLGLPAIPLLPPLATTTLTCCFGFFFAALLINFIILVAFSFSVIPSLPSNNSLFFLSFSKRCAALNFFLSLASRTFLMGRALRARSFSLMAA